MKLFKRYPLLNAFGSLFIDSPSPSNITYFWNFGSLLAINLVIMILTGVSLAMHYTPHVDLAFNSVEHIMRDVNSGWFIRYLHANGASMFFILVYLHIGRGLYYGSYRSPRGTLWVYGMIVFLLMILTGFLGYVLPWGQMSFWAATVITNLLSVMGEDIVYQIWGGFAVDNPTLNRFFSMHFLLPFVLTALVMLHIFALYGAGSNNPLGISANSDKIKFHPYFSWKDVVGFVVMLLVYSWLIFYFPLLLGHPDNSIPANPLVTPHHIVPEWYFLPFYAILRSIPDKLIGVIVFGLSVVIPVFLPLFSTVNVRSLNFKPLLNVLFWLFVVVFFVLMSIGSSPASDPYILVGMIASVLYFLYFIILFVIG